jgi:hypothetical protein
MQNRLDAFNEARSQAEARRHQVIRSAHTTFNKAVADEKLRQVAGEAFHTTSNPADRRAAMVALDRAIRAADAHYYAELAELGREH